MIKNSIQLFQIIQLYFCEVIEVIINRLNTCIALKYKDYQHYNFALNLIAYNFTSFRYEVYCKYLIYLQVEYPKQFDKTLFFMKNQVLSIESVEEREMLEKKIEELEEIIHNFSREVHDVNYTEILVKLKDEMDNNYEKIKERKINRFHKSFPFSIRNLIDAISDKLDVLHKNTSNMINSFSDVSMELETGYICAVKTHLQSFIKKLH